MEEGFLDGMGNYEGKRKCLERRSVIEPQGVRKDTGRRRFGRKAAGVYLL